MQSNKSRDASYRHRHSDLCYLVATETIDHHHAEEIGQHAEPLEDDGSGAEGPVGMCVARCVVLAVGTALAARQAVAGAVSGVPP